MIDVQRDNLISLAEAARVLGVSKQTVQNYRRRGQLETVRVGRLRKTTRRALQEFLDQQQGRSVPAVRSEISEALLSQHGIEI